MARDPIRRYLASARTLARWPLELQRDRAFERAVVIPILAEEQWIDHTLADLAANPADVLDTTLVLCVVNNRVGAAPEDRDDNRRVLESLRARMRDPLYPLCLGLIDASTPGHELPDKEGVGLARKIGMDHAIALMASNPGAVIISLDADARVDARYLPAIADTFDHSKCPGAVIEYAHDVSGSDAEAITRYEIYLRYHVLGLRYAQSPYAFHTIGSALALRAKAYAAVGGMPCRQGGEDFYLLQKVAKLAPLGYVRDTVVRPSPRPSHRVPFGTGPAVSAYRNTPESLARLYAPRVYDVLRQWLGSAGFAFNAFEALAVARDIEPELEAFLRANRFETAWEGLRKHAPDSARFDRQFARWFDGLRTLRLIHHLRDTACPSEEMFGAVHGLATMIGAKPPGGAEPGPDAQKVLEWLRTLQRTEYAV